MQPRTEPQGPGRLVGVVVVLILAATAGVMITRQLRRPQRSNAATTLSATEPSALEGLSMPWPAANPTERYGPDRLYEKVNGQADLYLQAGFSSLECRRFADPADPEGSIELRLFTMESAQAARSVHALQRRPEGAPMDADIDGECLDGACFLAHGPWYLELLPSSPGPERDLPSRALAHAFVDAHAVGAVQPEPSLPTQGLVAGSVAHGVQDAYGVGSLDGVSTAAYQIDGHRLLAWVARLESDAQADALADRVVDELEALGGSEQTQDGLQGARVVEFLDSACAVVVRGSRVAGVQEAHDPQAAVDLAARLVAHRPSELAP